MSGQWDDSFRRTVDILGSGSCGGKHVKVRCGSKGWTDSELVRSVVLLNLIGGECVEDLNRLKEE